MTLQAHRTRRFERLNDQQAAKAAKLYRDYDIPVARLAERFSCSTIRIAEALEAAGVPRTGKYEFSGGVLV